MGKIIVKKVITRKPGCLYYVDGAGNVCEAKMDRGGGKKKKKRRKYQECPKNTKILINTRAAAKEEKRFISLTK